MAEVASAFVTLVPSFKGGASAISRELGGPAEAAGRTAGKRTRKGFTSSFGGGGSLIPKAAILAGVAGLAVLGKASIDAAANAEQSIGASEAIFGKHAQTIIGNSKKAADSVGLDANTYRESANLIGSQLSNMGVSSDKLAGKTDGLIRKGADLASMFGGTTQDAVGALSSAFKGEFDPLERYGISLNQTKINAELLARGQSKLTGKSLDLAKQQVISDLVAKQSAKSTGNFARETDTLAHKQQVLKAKFENVKTSLGNLLLPVMSRLADLVSGLVPKVEDFIQGLKDGHGAGGKFAAAAKQVGEALKQGYDFFVKYQNILVPIAGGLAAAAGAVWVLNAAVKAYKAVQLALNAVMLANPLGIVILALVALAAGLVIAYKKSQTFRDIVDRAFDLIKLGALMMALAVVKAVHSFVNTFLSAVGAIIHAAAAAFGWVPGLGPKLKGAAEKIDGFKKSANASLSKVEKDLQVKVNTASADAALNEFRRRQARAIDVFVNVTTRSSGRVTIAGQSVNIGQRATGGPVTAGQPYIVGEKRPELFVPKTNGTIIPRVPSASSDGPGGSSGAAVFHLYDSDGALMGTMRGAARSELTQAARGVMRGTR